MKDLRPIPGFPLKFVFVKPKLWHLRCSGDGLGRVWWLGILPWPGVTWKTENKAPKGSRKSLTANTQICKSPQAVNELIPNLVQNKEKQLLPRVLQLPCNQDFNAQTRKAQRRRGRPRPPFSLLCAGHGKRAGEVPGGCCPVLQHRILQELPGPGPATSPQPHSSFGTCSQREWGRISSGRSIHNSGSPVDAQISTFPLATAPLGSPSGAAAAC